MRNYQKIYYKRINKTISLPYQGKADNGSEYKNREDNQKIEKECSIFS